MSEQPDWADEKAEVIIKGLLGHEMAALAAHLRLARQEGILEGICLAGRAINEPADAADCDPEPS